MSPLNLEMINQEVVLLSKHTQYSSTCYTAWLQEAIQRVTHSSQLTFPSQQRGPTQRFVTYPRCY